MGKPKIPADEPIPPPKNEISNAEIERRLNSLETSLTEIRKSHLEGHKWFTTVMFTLVAVLLTVLGIMSKTDVRDAIRDMKSDMRDVSADVAGKVDNETTGLEKKFAALSGEALKKPLLEILDSQGPLDGRVFEIPGNNSSLPFNPLFFKNIGDKRTEALSVELFTTADLFVNNGAEDWLRTPCNDAGFPFCYFSGRTTESRTAGIGIAPQDTWPLTDSSFTQIVFYSTNVVNCKLVVFYGGDKPAEARFTIKNK